MNARHSSCRDRNLFFNCLNQMAPVLISRSLVVILALFTTHRATAMIDLNTNTVSDVWEQIYGASGLAPGADSDGDGYSNLQEALAGTDPLNPNSVPKIASSAYAASTFSVTIPCELGKQYQLQSIASLGSTNWIVETNIVARAGNTLTLSAPAGSIGKFFRTAVSDVDTDGDGVSDWEEYKLGLDPLNPDSNNQLDGGGNLMGDYAFATNKLALQNIFTIVATDPVTVQPDVGSIATDFGMLTVSRGGFPLNTVTVNLALGGPGAGFATEGIDHAALPRSVTLAAGVSFTNISVKPLADTNLLVPVIAQMKLMPGTGYAMSQSDDAASVVIYPSPTSDGMGLTGYYYTNSSTTYTNAKNFNPTNLFLTRIDPTIDFIWGPTNTPNLSNGLYSVRWIGQVQPQYSETYYFTVKSDDGVKLWVNDQLLIDSWKSQNTELTASIALQADTRYNLKLEYLQNGGSAQAHLNWYSADQSKQIIPTSRLYATNGLSSDSSSNAPASITSSLAAVGFLGQPFSFAVTAANTPLGFTASNLPPGLAFNTTNGVISGMPVLAGNFQVPLTASNAAGLGASVVNITIFDTGSAVSREVWTNITGVDVADIPLATPPNITTGFGALEGITNYANNYGERIRGYFTAPATGNYYFWIAGGDSAQLWISDDSEPVNKILRGWVTPTNNPTASGNKGTSPHQWNLQTKQRSGWLALNAGQKYYLEILHKAGTGANDNWSVGWLQDPTGTNTTPAGVVPSYLISRYFTPPPATIPGTLYSANMLALPGINSDAVGSATLRVSADGSQAILNYSVNGIASTHVDHIYSDPYLNSPTTLVYDIAAAHPQADGSYIWNIKPTGSLSAADIQEILIEGKCSIVIATPANPAGEIGGHFTLASGSQTFSPPPAPPAWVDDSKTTNGAVRFLTQASYGADLTDIAYVKAHGYDGWINNQISLSATHHLPVVLANMSTDPSNPFPSSDWFNSWWQNAVTAPDQLRQRVAFALSEIMVISENGTLQDHAQALAYYYDALLDNAFGNFRDLLKTVTLTPAMGVYLNMQGNDKGNLPNGTHANENYAREINQLFSIGLNRLWPDGSLILNSSGNLVPTYNQNVINGFAATFTGWNYYQTNQANGRLPSNFFPASNWTNQMVLVPTHHDLNAKLLLNNVVLPPAWGDQANSASNSYDVYCSQNLEQALDSIYNNPNVGPFICRQLIQRLVTSNPSRDYLYRVSQVFNDNGSGVRGDMSAVVNAILLDYEARSTNLLNAPTYGKQREPLLRVTAMARAFPSPPNQTGTYAQSGTQTNKITLPQPHHMNNGDTVALSFTDTSGKPVPPAQNYVATITNSTTFTVIMPGLATGTYGQTNNVIMVTMSSHGLAVGFSVYLTFTSGSAINGVYQVNTVPDSSHFTVTTTDATTNSGNCLFPRLTGGGFTVQNRTNLTVITTLAHGLSSGNNIYLNFTQAGSPTNGVYTIASVPDATHFTVITVTNGNQTQDGLTTYPLVAPPLTRSGKVTAQWSTWNMSYTDTSSSSSLSQSPLRSPTVFNFYYPNYEFPGALSSAGLTTPEFQLTSVTGVALQMNFLEGALLGNTGNTNGLSSFTGGDGDIVLDIGPWMTTNYTANAGIPVLVDRLNTLLLAGQLNASARTNIINYVTNTASGYFPYSTPPTQTQIRDRVRAVVHLLTASPDFTIQK